VADSASMTLVVVRDRIPELRAKLTAAGELGLDKITSEIEQQADAAAPTRTGGLRASRFRITGLTDEFGSAVGALMSRNPKATAISNPGRPGHGAVVGFAAGYARAVNDGHHTRSGSFVAGRPFFTSAVEANREKVRQFVIDQINEAIGK
jgi:hypothetical protein